MLMEWEAANYGTLLICALLTLLTAFITVVLSVLCGAALAFDARPTLRYITALVLLFIPFAIGSSVWAYSITRLVVWTGIQSDLVMADTWYRSIVLLLLCIGRTLPLGVFFCATTLQRYTTEVRPYLQTHHIGLPFFLLCALNRIPKSTLMLLGLFGGALMSSEASLPTFLYRANPGTQPETVNIMLSRLFREYYASAGSESLSQVAILGLFVSLLLMTSAFLGTVVGRGLLSAAGTWIGRDQTFRGFKAKAVSAFVYVCLAFCMLPGVFCLIGLYAPINHIEVTYTGTLEKIFDYRGIILLGVLVGVTIIIIGIALSVKMRYGQKDWLSWIEMSKLSACILMLPAFIPILSVIAVLGNLSNGQMDGLAGYLSLYISHFGLHYSIFQFICITLITAIPERHVSWQRAMKIGYSFSLITDGFKRHAAFIIGLLGLCTVQVMTDGSVSRWFTHLVKAPEEAFYAAIFGRLSNVADAVIIAWSIGLVAIAVCSILATAYARELANR